MQLVRPRPRGQAAGLEENSGALHGLRDMGCTGASAWGHLPPRLSAPPKIYCSRTSRPNAIPDRGRSPLRRAHRCKPWLPPAAPTRSLKGVAKRRGRVSSPATRHHLRTLATCTRHAGDQFRPANHCCCCLADCCPPHGYSKPYQPVWTPRPPMALFGLHSSPRFHQANDESVHPITGCHRPPRRRRPPHQTA